MSVSGNLLIKKKEKMKKFNGFEKSLIVDALNYYVANLAIIDLAQSILYDLIESSTLLESSIVN